MVNGLPGAVSLPLVEATPRAATKSPQGFIHRVAPPLDPSNIKACRGGKASGVAGYCLPALLGICCVHSGTTSLANDMDAHPQLSFGIKKEHRWLMKYNKQAAGVQMTRAEGADYKTGLDYIKGFPAEDDVLLFDFSPTYISSVAPAVAQEVLGPDLKVLVLARNAPYQLCWYHAFSWEKLRQAHENTKQQRQIVFLKRHKANLECLAGQTLTAETKTNCGDVAQHYCYADKLADWADTFGTENILVLSMDQIAANLTTTQAMLDQVASLAGVDPFDLPPETVSTHDHRSGVVLSAEQDSLFQQCLAKQRAPGAYMRLCDDRLWAQYGPKLTAKSTPTWPYTSLTSGTS